MLLNVIPAKTLKVLETIFDRETRSIAVLEVLKLLLLLGQTLIKKLQKVFLIVIVKSATCKQFLLQRF